MTALSKRLPVAENLALPLKSVINIIIINYYYYYYSVLFRFYHVLFVCIMYFYLNK